MTTAAAPVAPAAPTTTVAPKAAAPVAPKPVEAPKAAPPKADAAPPKLTLTVDGKPVEMTLEQAKVELQKGMGANKRLQEAAAKEKQARELVEMFEKDPESALKKLGKDPEAILESLAQRKAKLAAMTPEQRRIEELEGAKSEAEAKLKQAEDEKQAAKDSELVKQTETWIERELLQAAERNQADGTPEMLETMALVGLELGEYGITPQTPGWADMVVREAQSRVDGQTTQFGQKQIQKAVAAGDVGRLKAILGPEAVALLLKDSVTTIPSAGQKPKASAEPVKREGKGHVSPADFDKKFGFSARK
jgi:hypothetical protein